MPRNGYRAGTKPCRDQGFRLGGDARTVLVVRLGRLGRRPKRPRRKVAAYGSSATQRSSPSGDRRSGFGTRGGGKSRGGGPENGRTVARWPGAAPEAPLEAVRPAGSSRAALV